MRRRAKGFLDAHVRARALLLGARARVDAPAPAAMRVGRILRVLAVLPLLGACTDLGRYDGDWEGTVVGDAESGFIRSGFLDETVLELRDFHAPPLAGARGTLTTSDGAFASTPLEVIAPLEHDELSRYELPGSGRLKSYIFAARPTAGPIANRDAMVFLSLMEGDVIEMRVIVGNGDEASGGHFGLFRLEKIPDLSMSP
jgi:hypothetical protein